jgi:hypothetical protein
LGIAFSWSECGVDNFDDDGENRDGDENWYLYRTQGLCANAAYSLYGVKKSLFAVPLNTCARGTYINSFFTYGGADVLAKALDLSISRYFNNNDDGYGNAVCYGVEGENNNNGHSNDNNNKDKNNNNDDDSSSISSTMGCAADGSFAMAQFKGDSCDGKYFLETTDPLTSYNKAMTGVSCTRIWSRRSNNGNTRLLSSSAKSYNSVAERLLRNSWACDIDLYPHACPDPYHLKQKYAGVERATTNSKLARLVVANAKFKLPIRIISWLSLVSGMAMVVSAYYRRKKERIDEAGGGIRGWLIALYYDFGRLSRRRNRRKQRNTYRSSSSEGKSTMAEGGNSKKNKKKKKRSSSRRKDGRPSSPLQANDQAEFV